ncbi:MAG TPA: NAD(P)-dependent oxidoreductase [Candidatus Cybelea sp.]|nr:NAD(P)-dependent oxidoreductase [Candidatus Cybelea sp.]
MMNVGIVGLGKMGGSIARNLLDRKYPVWVWNRSRPAVDELAAAGATPCADLRELLAAVDAVIIMLWGDDVARAVTLQQIVPAARKGQLVIESSTLSPAMYETLAAAAATRGIDFLACPVIGSVDSARAGSLTILPGGTPQAFERARDLLGAMGSTVTFTNSPSASGFLKLGSNAILGIVADSLGELLRVTESAGVDRALAIDLFVRAFERAGGKRQQLLDRDTAPRFSAAALLKDLRLAKEARASVGQDAHVLDCVLEEFEEAVKGGIGDRDYIAVALASETVKAS